MQLIALADCAEKTCVNEFEERPLKDKLKKLKENLDEAIEFFAKNDPDKATEFRSWQVG